MGLLRLIGTALAVVAAVSLVIGGAGFTQMTADRTMDIAVVGDDQAYVGYAAEDVSVESGETVTLVSVTNRFPRPIDVESVSVEGAQGMSVALEPYPSDIAERQTADVRGTVQCDQYSERTVDVTIRVAGESVQAELYGDTRSFTLSCRPSGPVVQSVSFGGNGNANITATERFVSVRVWKYDDGMISLLGNTTIDTSESVRGQLPGAADATIVAVSIPADGVTYVHPQLDTATTTLQTPINGGPGDEVQGVRYDEWTG